MCKRFDFCESPGESFLEDAEVKFQKKPAVTLIFKLRVWW